MVSGYVSRILVCTECNEEFVFTADAQEYLVNRGFTNDPRKCKACHITSKRGLRLGTDLDKERVISQDCDADASIVHFD